ncbi:MAG: hypothetical protein KF734_04400 [Saprospiraceae bacterium]|nr:hypothetical protein [Saprospiraceae bacterium]
MSNYLTLLVILLFWAAEPPRGIYFRFKEREMLLLHPMRKGKGNYMPRDISRGNFSNKKLDSLSNWYDVERQYVEIIRQDHPTHPTIGLALGFDFDEEREEYPYKPTFAAMQLKDFGWGGVEFDTRDTMNYTGVTNSVSSDLSVEVTAFRNDTIIGTFSGVLLSGAGTMAEIENGTFRVRVYRR